MSPQDFRLGNIIQSDGEQFVIDRIEKHRIGAGALTVHPAGFELDLGIPLTEEWLIKFGWTCKEGRITHILPVPNSHIGTEIETTLQCQLPMTHMSICRSGINGLSVDIQYVHQLQNLYYALTGS